MEITHSVLKTKCLDVLLKGAVSSPVSSWGETEAGKGGTSWHRLIHGGAKENSDLWLPAPFISCRADALSTEEGTDSSRSVSNWSCLNPAICILNFFTVLTNRAQDAQPNESPVFHPLEKQMILARLAVTVLIMKTSIYLWFF